MLASIGAFFRRPIPLWILSGSIPLLTHFLKQEEKVREWLLDHKLSDSILKPFGISLAVWWVFMFVVNEFAVRFAGIKDRNEWIEAQHGLLSKLSGGVDSLGRTLRGGGGYLNDDTARGVIRSFLARAVEYAQLFVNDPKVQFRACFLPLTQRGPRQRQLPERYLRAYEYDSTHSGTFGSTIAYGKPLAGMVAEQKRALLIDDVQEFGEDFPDRKYRSIIGLPVLVGGPGGELIGVVTIDASKPKVFSKRNAGAKIEDATSPLLALIAVAYKARRPS